MSLRVLVADDMSINRILIKRMLAKVDVEIEIKEVGDGEEAVNVFQEWYPHIVFMDLHMPELDGFQATRQIKLQNPETLVFAVTGSSFPEELEKISAMGCDGIIEKPFTVQDIENALGMVKS